MISLVASRFDSTPDKPVTLVAGSGADLARRVQAAQRPSRDGVRDAVVADTVAVATVPPPPPTTAAPVVRPAATVAPQRVVRQQSTPATTAKPKPKPAPTTTTAAPAPPRQQPAAGGNGNTEEGKASFYRAAYHADDPWICAHKTLPKGTSVTVTATSSGKSITCRVGDRGPYVEGRIIDLSEHAFSQLAPTSAGVISVRLSW